MTTILQFVIVGVYKYTAVDDHDWLSIVSHSVKFQQQQQQQQQQRRPTCLLLSPLAKKCHPDALQKTENKNMDIAKEFRLVTLAYEKLSNGSTMTQLHNNEDGNLSINQQLQFRSACQTILGVPAEIVEECKRDAKFRQWLLGNNHTANYWNNFLSVHGGLAPMLETTAGYLGRSQGYKEQKSEARRKRVPRKG
jgi:hypothetical protein